MGEAEELGDYRSRWRAGARSCGFDGMCLMRLNSSRRVAIASRALLLTGSGMLIASSVTLGYLLLTARQGRSRDLPAGIWALLALGPTLGVPLVVASGILSWWGGQWTARRLTTLGMKGIGLGVLAVIARVAATGRWLPGSTVGVVLFVLTELVWIPTCVIVATGGLGLHALCALRRRALVQTQGSALRSSLAVGIIIGATLTSCLVAWQVSPRLSRRLEWGRYGFLPPVELCSLAEVTRKTTLRFPLSAQLVGGEFLSGPRSYLIARVTMPAGDLGRFFGEQPFHWSQRSADEPVFTEQQIPMMVDRGWRISSATHLASAVASAPDGTPTLGNLEVVAAKAGPQEDDVYIYWLDIDQHWNW